MEKTQHFLKETGIDVIFVGNPGAGKSTLLSNLSGQQFDSGVSFGGGFTTELKFEQDKNLNIRWADTPGLADVAVAEQAAAAISTGLENAKKSGRAVKLVFVCTTDAGRVKHSDVMTIDKVIASIKLPSGEKLPPNSYHVLINKFNKKLFEGKDFATNGRMQIEALFNGTSGRKGAPRTNAIYYAYKFRELEDEDDARIKDATYIEELKKAIIYASPVIQSRPFVTQWGGPPPVGGAPPTGGAPKIFRPFFLFVIAKYVVLRRFLTFPHRFVIVFCHWGAQMDLWHMAPWGVKIPKIAQNRRESRIFRNFWSKIAQNTS